MRHTERTDTPTDRRWTSSAIRDLLEQATRPGVISLAGGLPATESLPVERLARCSDDVFDRQGSTSLQYSSTQGEPALRELLASFEAVHPDDLIVTTGSQQALDLVARTIARTGDDIVVEAPGYVGGIQVFRGQQLTMHGVPVDEDGLDTDVLSSMLDDELRPAFVYTNPLHQNPTGARLSPRRQQHLQELADRFDFVIVVDDPYREITFDGPVPSPEDGLHPSSSDRVVLLGSLSKTLSPGLRIGWCSGPSHLMRTITIAKQAADLHTPTLNQLIAAGVLSDHRWWIQHLQELRTLYRHRRDALSASIDRHLPSVGVTEPTGGFFTWVDLGTIDTQQLLDIALDTGVAFVPGSAFSTDDRPESTLRLSYSFADIDQFDEGLRRLVEAIQIAQTSGRTKLTRPPGPG